MCNTVAQWLEFSLFTSLLPSVLCLFTCWLSSYIHLKTNCNCSQPAERVGQNLRSSVSTPNCVEKERQIIKVLHFFCLLISEKDGLLAGKVGRFLQPPASFFFVQRRKEAKKKAEIEQFYYFCVYFQI